MSSGCTAPRLVLLPCHAVYRGRAEEATAAQQRQLAVRTDASWVLQAFQRGEGTVFVDHIQAALAELQRDLQAVLIFSGGITRAATPQRSEARSYWLAALDLASDPTETAHLSAMLAQGRILLEEAARDSCENLAFSLALYRQNHGCLPPQLTVIGWPFKEDRFRAHLAALGVAETLACTYQGVGVPADQAGAEAGEATTRCQFAADPYGNHTPLLEKRRQRNPLGLPPPPYMTDPLCTPLLW